MSITLKDITTVDFGKFGSAVDDWQKMAKGLKGLARDAEDGLYAKSESARWEGANAAVSRGFIKKTTKEFTDAHKEADSVYQVLSDAHHDLLELQRKIRNLVEIEAAELGVTLEDAGSGKVRWRGSNDNHAKAAQALADRASTLLGQVVEIDKVAAGAVRKAVGNDNTNFGHAEYTSLDDAEAERAAELARKRDNMTNVELAEFNALVERNAKRPEFSTELFKDLGGPRKTLEFYAYMSLDGTGDISPKRLALTQDLQRQLGTALATATDPDNKPNVSEWTKEFQKLGHQRLHLDPPPSMPQNGDRASVPPPYGYQVLGGILRYGNYDKEFLLPVAEHVIQSHRANPEKYVVNSPFGTVDADYGFNPSGKDGNGYDPLTSVLEALGHSPEAATAMFSESYVPTVYDEVGNVQNGEKAGFNYFDELTGKDFKWTDEVLSDPDWEHGQNALGHALEAAARGVPYDSDAMTPPHSEERAGVAHRIIEHYGKNPDLLEGAPFRDSLGNVAAEYMRDIQSGMMGNYSTIEPYGESANLGMGGGASGLEAGAMERFLRGVATDPSAYGAIMNSQQAVTTETLNDAFREGYSDMGTEVENRVQPGGKIAGIMADGRVDSVFDAKIASDAEFNAKLQEGDKWVGRAIEMGTERVRGGEGLVVVGEEIRESVLENYTRDSSAKADEERHNELEIRQWEICDATERAAYIAARDAGLEEKEARSNATAARRQMETSFDLPRGNS